MHHRLKILLLAGWLVVVTAAFEYHDTTESHAANLEIAPAASASAIGPDDFPTGVNPLTGLLVADPSALMHNPIVVKISNAPPLVRPQAGIGAADLVFEHYAEGGLTRFSAVFYSQTPERVGSIRSARLIDYELVPMYQSLLAFSGASTGVEERLNGSEFANRLYKGVLYGLPYYWRDETIPVPHNLFTNLSALRQLAVTEGVESAPDLHGMVFNPDVPADSSGPIHLIDLRYRATRVQWEYDAASGLYRRFADGQGHYDANTDEQITAANVVVLYADHTFTDIVESQFQGSVSYSIEIKLWFEGDAVLFRDGQQYPARWVRPTRESLIALRTPDGEFLPLKPGNTWFQVFRPLEQQNPVEEWLKVE
ncbi:MAG: DUF3048 domain-containing protein [Anaerolineae bacterium]|nr:DUF3048 domain-containing protein [Anaerolineae bacterium]